METIKILIHNRIEACETFGFIYKYRCFKSTNAFTMLYDRKIDTLHHQNFKANSNVLFLRQRPIPYNCEKFLRLRALQHR